MAAYDILRSNMPSIVDTLGANYKLILYKAYEKKLITRDDYLLLERCYFNENYEDLMDMIMNKGEENCQLFLDLLQTDRDIQDTFPELKYILEDGQYELKSQPTGLCLIINNESFSGGDVRQGTDKDAKRLGEVFTSLGFRVLMCKDQTKDQMERTLKCFASQWGLTQLQEFNVKEWQKLKVKELQEFKVKESTDSGFTNLLKAPQHGDAFICCVLSHGDKGVVSGVDGKLLPIKDITRTFMATPESPLSDKPKVFLIQACQGHQIHPVVSDGLLKSDLTPQADESLSTRQADDSHSTPQATGSQSTFIPQEADFLVHCSTVQDYFSFRNPEKGSWFIQSVCKQLKEGCKRNEEIEVILRRVNKEVAGIEYVFKSGPECGPECGPSGCPKCGRTTQMPAIRHTLTKRLVLKPRN